MRRARQGDATAGRALVAGSEGALCAYLARRGASQGEVEELFQETWSRAWAALGSFDGRASFSTWLLVIGRRVLADRGRARDNESLRESAVQRDPEAELEQREHGEAIVAALGLLGGREREALELRYLDGLRFKEIAEIMGIAEATARHYARDGVLALAQKLRDRGEAS